MCPARPKKVAEQVPSHHSTNLPRRELFLYQRPVLALIKAHDVRHFEHPSESDRRFSKPSSFDEVEFAVGAFNIILSRKVFPDLQLSFQKGIIGRRLLLAPCYRQLSAAPSNPVEPFLRGDVAELHHVIQDIQAHVAIVGETVNTPESAQK